MVRTIQTCLGGILSGVLLSGPAQAAEPSAAPPIKISQESQACIKCHELYTPGIVRDWQKSLHARTTPRQALLQEEINRRISVTAVPEELAGVAVGCYECHSRNADTHKDHFRHNGYMINVIVSPADCKVCHEKEVVQYTGTKKAHAVGNLMSNPVYHGLVQTVTGVKRLVPGGMAQDPATMTTLTDTCLGCHGAVIEVKGMKKIQTPVGEISVPDLSPWPNQGVGRVNPDGSMGTCTSCHSRHTFSIEMARKPATCGQCHLDPDVPAYNVYNASKHGNLYYSLGSKWNFTAVPWKLGEDFQSPTCATCHTSLVVKPNGAIIAERTHDFGARLWVRLFGLPYSHPQPVKGDTTIIRNSDGLPLPTNLSGQPASAFLITPDEQQRRQKGMQTICINCHGTSWTEGHFNRLAATVKETDAMTLVATQLLADAWQAGVADKTIPFDEAIEKQWLRQWLFYGNSVRYASAMSGAFDYAAFKNGWWEMSEDLERMRDKIETMKWVKEKKEKKEKKEHD